MSQTEKQLILPTQKSQVFSCVQESGLIPSDFEWEEYDSKESPGLKVSRLFHRPTGFYFIFDFYEDHHFGVWSPTEYNTIGLAKTDTWGFQFDRVKGWLKYVKREIEEPDLWEALSQETKLAEVASSSETTNSPFTPEELQYISRQVEEIKGYLIETHSLADEEQRKFVNTRLNYLVDSAQRQGRRDWLHTTIGVVVTVVVGIGLAPDETRELFRFVATAFGQFFGGTPPIPLAA